MNNLILFSAVFVVFLISRTTSNAQDNYSLKGKYVIVLDIQDIATKEVMVADDAKALIDEVNKVIEISDTDKVIYIEAVAA